MTSPLNDDPGQGNEGDALATLKVLRHPSESRSVEILSRPGGGANVVVRHLMDGWGLWVSSVFPPTQDTVLRRVRYATSREELFDAP